jgi:uncharacterized protein (DUF1778 family)
VAHRQLNIRLDIDDYRVLDAAAWLDDTSVAEFVRPALSRLIIELRRDPEVSKAIRLRTERAARKEGKLTSLHDRRDAGEVG